MPLFSLKELITQSAKQLKYLRDFPNKKKKPTEAQYEGISFQDKIANSIYGVISQEMGNFIPFNGNRIYFSCDIVGRDFVIETKNVQNEYKDYYLNSCLLQCAAYKSAILSVGNKLVTSKFYSNRTGKEVSFTLNPYFRYFLFFGEKQKFEVITHQPNEIINFYIDKAKASFSYDEAKKFDELYKHKEFEILSNLFDYRRIS